MSEAAKRAIEDTEKAHDDENDEEAAQNFIEHRSEAEIERTEPKR